MSLELPSSVVIRTSQREFTLQKHWVKAVAAGIAAQTTACLVLVYALKSCLQGCSCETTDSRLIGALYDAGSQRLDLDPGNSYLQSSSRLPSTPDISMAQAAPGVALIPTSVPAPGYAGPSGLAMIRGGQAAGGPLSSSKIITQFVSHVYGDNGQILPRNFTSFENVLAQSRSDKKIHHFGHMYAEYLDPIRLEQDEVNMLEIGLRDGDSVNLWLTAFSAGKVYGLEYNPNPMSHMRPRSSAVERVIVFIGDQANVTLLNEIVKEVKKEVGLLDFIVDDGGHTMEQQITSFTHLMPLVQPGGFYFIEDLQTSYWRNKCYHHWNFQKYCYGGGPPGTKNTTIDLMKSLIDVLNADFIEDHQPPNRLGSGVFRVNPADILVGSIKCWRNMCALRRKLDDHF